MLGVVAAIVFLAVLLLGAVHAAVLANLPEELVLDREVEEEDLPPEVVELARTIEGLGFERIGPALHVPLRPPSLILPLMSRAEACYACVIRAAATPPRTIFEFVTRFEQEDGCLSTTHEPSAGVLPAGAADFRQIFPGADPATVHARHVEGVRHLREKGLRLLSASPERFEQGLCDAFPRVRRAFLEARVRNTLTALGRTLTKRSPFEGPVASQPRAAIRIRRLTGALHAEAVL